MLDYQNDLYIDETALEQEWLEQVSLALKYGREYANARKALQIREERVKVVRAELIKEAEENPEECCGKEKLTKTDLESYYRTHEKHKEAKKKLIQKAYELDMAEIAKNEICYTRKKALENLVILHGQQYFAGPSIPRDIEKERRLRTKELSESANDTVVIKSNRKGKRT